MSILSAIFGKIVSFAGNGPASSAPGTPPATPPPMEMLKKFSVV